MRNQQADPAASRVPPLLSLRTGVKGDCINCHIEDVANYWDATGNVGPLCDGCARVLAEHFASLVAPAGVPLTTDEDFATLLELHQGSPAPTRVAAFLRLYAGRIRKNERWDVPETMARSYESAAQALDNYMAVAPTRVTEPQCADCGVALNAGEAKCFTVCDACWDKAYPPKAAVGRLPALERAERQEQEPR